MGDSPGKLDAGIDDDGIVHVADYAMVLSDWGACE